MSVTLKDCVDPHDVTDFRFQGLRKVRLADGPLSLASSTMSLVTTVPHTGLVLVVGDCCVHVLKTEDVEEQDQCNKAQRAVENKQLDKVKVELPGEVISVGVSCDGLTTSIVVKVGQFPTCLLFDTRGLVSSPPDLALSSTSLNTTSSSSLMTGLHWNPALPDMFCVTWSDGSLALYTVKTDGSTDCLTLPPAAGVVAMAWSPKGKQLVVVKKNRDLVQYKPDLSVAKYPTLKEMKTMVGPAQPSLVPVSIAWLSTYEFLVGLREDGDSEARPGLWVVKGSKEGHVEHTPYDDICYSTGEGEGMVFSSHSLQEWGVVVVVSSASIELGVLGTEGGAYTQWVLEDNGRAEVPLSSNNDECYPVGLAVDYTATTHPLLYLLSSDGLLCPFYCVYTRQGAAQLARQRVGLPQGKRTGTVQLPPPATSKNPGTVSAVATTTTLPPKPAVNLSNIFTQSPTSSFAQSTPLKPLPPSTPVFHPPPTKDPTPPLPDLSTVTKQPAQPVSAFTKVPTPPLSQLAKDPPTPVSKLSVEPVLPFGKPAKEPTPPSAKLAKEPFPFSKGSTPSSKGPSPASDFQLTPKETTPLSDSTSAKVSAAINEEFEAFNAEVAELATALSGMKTFIGTQQDKISLCTRTEACSKFCRDVIDTTQCQNTEIFSLRSSTLETFSWLEEARARDTSTGDTKYLQLLRARPLDPRSLRKMEDLRAQFFYCEQQVEEAGNALDSQWEEHVGKLKRTVRSDEQSVREELSQAVMTNHKILERQSETIEEISDKVAELHAAYPLTMGRPGRSPGKGKAESELDKLAEQLKEKSKLSPAKAAAVVVSTPSPARLTASAMVSPVKALNPSTDKALRAMLDNRPLCITKAVTRESPNIKAADQPSSAKLLEKLKDSTTPTISKIVPSGSLSSPRLSADKSAFQAVPSTISKGSAFQPVSLPKKSSVFTSGSLSVEVSASPASKPIKVPVYEPISPASNSPEKNDQPKESIKAEISLPSIGSFGASLVKTAACPVATASQHFSFASSDPLSAAKSLFPTLGSAVTSSAGSSEKTGFSFGSSATSLSSSLSLSAKSSASVGSGSLFGSSSSSAASSTESVTGFNSKPAVSIKPPSSIGLSVTSSPAPKDAVSTVSGTGFGYGGSSTSLGAAFGSVTASSTAVTSNITGEKDSLSKSKKLDVGLEESTSSPGGKDVSAAKPTQVSASVSPSLSTSSIFGGSSKLSSELGQTVSSGSDFGVSTKISSKMDSKPTTGGSQPIVSVFGGAAASTSSVFGGEPKSTTSTESAFGGATQSVFGGATRTTASTGSVFGGATQSAAFTGSVFGGATNPAASTGSVFGGTAQPASSTASVFGAAPRPAASTASVFGGATKLATSTESVFGGSSQLAASTGSVFGGATQPAALTGSVFGGATKTIASTGSVFGGATQPATSTASVFGGASQPDASTPTGSVFGGTTQPGASTPSVFGGAPQPAASTGSVFGGRTQPAASTASVFGGATQKAATSGSVFGGATKPAASTGSVFGGAPQPVSSSGSVFGGANQPAASAGSVFGGGSQPTPSAASVFGGTPKSVASTGSVFGGTSQLTSSGSAFGGSGNTSGSIFGGGSITGSGGFLGGLGGTASSDNSNKNPFGGAGSTFGSSPSGGLFGSSASPSVFGGASQGSTFVTSSSFSAGANIASQGFGVQSTPTKPAAGFGAAPAFGSPPALGSPAAFGSPAGFGSAPAFGGASAFGVGSTFGSASSSAAPTFGAAANAPTFGSMSGSAAPAFGSMASSASPFGSIASSTPAFGSSGSAFGGGAPTSPPPAGQQFNSWR